MPWAITEDDDVRLIGYLRQGIPISVIARKLGMPTQTTRSRVSRLYRKHNVHNRQELLNTLDQAERSAPFRPDLLSAVLTDEVRKWTQANSATDALTDALTLAFEVRTAPPTDLRLRLRRWLNDDPERAEAVILMLAALLPLDQSPSSLLRWLTDRPRQRRARPVEQTAAGQQSAR